MCNVYFHSKYATPKLNTPVIHFGQKYDTD